MHKVWSTAVLTIALALLLPGMALAQSAGSAVFGYDAAGRLVSAVYPSGVCVSYVYDANGNQVSRSVNTAAAVGSLVYGAGRWACSLWASGDGALESIRNTAELSAKGQCAAPGLDMAEDRLPVRVSGR